MLQTIKKRRSQAGFTLVELLIVIVVIAILAAIAITAFSGVQARARDSQRQSDISQVKQALEVHFADEGEYPATPTDLANLDGIEPEALQAPDETSSSFQASASTGPDQYGYVVTASGGGACTDAANDCTSYTLSWWSEEEDAIRNVQDVGGE